MDTQNLHQDVLINNFSTCGYNLKIFPFVYVRNLKTISSLGVVSLVFQTSGFCSQFEYQQHLVNNQASQCHHCVGMCRL